MGAAFHSRAPPPQRRGLDGSVVYMVSNSHIDTQWNWTVQDTIRQWVPRTFFDNFKLFEQFPNYKFNFEGVIHYMFFKEYHPEEWPKLQSYVSNGRWKFAGSWLNAVDANVPSPESLMRQALYGRRFFRQDSGTRLRTSTSLTASASPTPCLLLPRIRAFAPSLHKS